MSLTPEMVVVLVFSFFSFFCSSSFVLLLKNKNKLLATPQGSISLMWFTYLVSTFFCVIIFLTPLTQERSFFWLLIATDFISIIFPLFIPSRSIEKLYPSNVSSTFHAVGVNVEFKPEFNTYKIIWLGRHLLIILLILVFFLFKSI